MRGEVPRGSQVPYVSGNEISPQVYYTFNIPEFYIILSESIEIISTNWHNCTLDASHSIANIKLTDNLGAILGGVLGGIVLVAILLVCTCCFVVGWARSKRRRNGRVSEGIDEQDCSDVALLNPEQQFSDTAPSTYNQIECPPNTSEEGISVQAVPHPLPPEAPPPTPNCEDMSDNFSSVTLVRRGSNLWPVSYPLATSEEDTPTPPRTLPLWPEILTDPHGEEPWPSENQMLTLVRRRCSPASQPRTLSSTTEDVPTPPQSFLPEISFPSPTDEDRAEHLCSQSGEREKSCDLLALA